MENETSWVLNILFSEFEKRMTRDKGKKVLHLYTLCNIAVGIVRLTAYVV
jgi:hypothetical protein